MPIYEYECRACGERTEVIQRFGDPPLAACPKCGGELRKLFSAPSFQFKGSGWYATDYAGRKSGDEGAKAAESGASDAADKAGKAEPADKSPAATAETKSGATAPTPAAPKPTPPASS